MSSLSPHARRCDVCNEIADLVVSSSVLVAMSCALCMSCLKQGLEPYGCCVAACIFVGGDYDSKTPLRDRLHSSVVQHLRRSLMAQGKTWEDLEADVRESEREFLTAHSQS